MPEQFVLGHPTIDVQHEVLFALYHEVCHSLDGEEDGFDLGDIFLGLNLYLTTHLEFEEEAMEATDYPDIESHREGHRALTEGVLMLYGQFQSAAEPEESRIIARKIADFLYAWLENHIARVDRLLCRYLLGQVASA
ncbi:MAG: hemerythrin domain-containing protein [Magnetococcales bacterium]|nr:hemerythrin domain-containing protein [Magnetococcales bacterium]